MAEPSENLSRETVNQDGTEGRDEPPAGTGDPAVTVPRGISSPNRSKKLVLHVDLNNTILISDAVRSQGTVAALEYFLTTVTWGRMSKHGTVTGRRLWGRGSDAGEVGFWLVTSS